MEGTKPIQMLLKSEIVDIFCNYFNFLSKLEIHMKRNEMTLGKNAKWNYQIIILGVFQIRVRNFLVKPMLQAKEIFLADKFRC